MHSNSRSRFAAFATCTVGLLALAACGSDPRLEQLTAGIARDSVLRVIGQDGAAGDRLPNVYSTSEYLSQGQMLEVLYFDPDGRKSGTDSLDVRKELTPVVMVDGALGGHGWSYFDSVAAVHHIDGAGTESKQQ